MTKSPFFNAALATLYIAIVASVMTYVDKMSGPPKSIIVPVAVLSLFTLSAAVMGYLFLYQPARLYLDGKKKEAVSLFLQTVAVFAGITVLAFALLFSGVMK